MAAPWCGELSFRRLARGDLRLLAGWLADPDVSGWWPDDRSPEGLERRYGPCVDGSEPTEVFVAVVDGAAAGIAQRYRIGAYPAWEATLRGGAGAAIGPGPAAGIDYLIGPARLRGRGLGRELIARFSAGVFADLPDVCSIVVSVQQANLASWRALERAGYRRAWEGTLASDDPSDDGPQYVLVLPRGGQAAR